MSRPTDATSHECELRLVMACGHSESKCSMLVAFHKFTEVRLTLLKSTISIDCKTLPVPFSKSLSAICSLSTSRDEHTFRRPVQSLAEYMSTTAVTAACAPSRNSSLSKAPSTSRCTILVATSDTWPVRGEAAQLAKLSRGSLRRATNASAGVSHNLNQGAVMRPSIALATSAASKRACSGCSAGEMRGKCLWGSSSSSDSSGSGGSPCGWLASFGGSSSSSPSGLLLLLINWTDFNSGHALNWDVA
mmetsp:Transcript_19505/g.33718  ORF Transcript_19505/g.33718 Transcript_19505/m.33718 type:complete len:247 (-) Transcript_19505:68-808(-)